MAGFWGKRKRDKEELEAQDADLARRARTALVAADERIRVTTDELAFADAELGPGATKDLREALESVRTHLGEAFHLHQLNHDEIPDTPEELRTRNARIVQLCEWAEELIDDRTQALAEPIARARRAPEIIAGVRADAERIRARLPHARETVQRLAVRYSLDALAQVDANPAEAEQLIGFAEHSAAVAERRRDAGQREQANLALEAATEAARRAATLVDAVETFEVEALRAESTLSAIIEDSREDLIAARTAPQLPAVTAAVAELEAALRALPAAGVHTDPFSQLSRLREANAGLDAAIAAARERASRVIPPLEHVRHSIDDADRQLAVARDVIAGHRGWIGADARTRLAEAERIRIDLDRRLGMSASTATDIDEDDRDDAMAMSRRVAFLAGEALQLAQRDINSSRPQGPPGGWGGPQQGGWGGGGRGGSDIMGGILGGLVIGSLLDGMFE
jgi:DNA repair exonuclease SbcCD ATPase subunit